WEDEVNYFRVVGVKFMQKLGALNFSACPNFLYYMYSNQKYSCHFTECHAFQIAFLVNFVHILFILQDVSLIFSIAIFQIFKPHIVNRF
ncbi:hypothetical protein ACJX0J_026012, partial [Zea mays]